MFLAEVNRQEGQAIKGVERRMSLCTIGRIHRTERVVKDEACHLRSRREKETVVSELPP